MTTPQSLIELCARTVEALRVNGGQEWGEGHLIAVQALTEAAAAIRALSVDATPDGRKCACYGLGLAGVVCNGWKGGCACCTPPVCKQCGHSEACHSLPAEPIYRFGEICECGQPPERPICGRSHNQDPAEREESFSWCVNKGPTGKTCGHDRACHPLTETTSTEHK